MASFKIAFSDGAKEYNPVSGRIISVLNDIQAASESSFEDADLLIYSDFGHQHWAFKGLKIYVTGENMLPDFNQCDLAFSPHEDLADQRCIRLPYYAQLLPLRQSLVRSKNWDPEGLLNRPRFCSFIASNARGPIRNAFFKKLNRVKKVDSAGRHFNNWGAPIENKLKFLENYRFNIAFENSSSPGYITEKLIDPLISGCIPVYWGAPDVNKDFNEDCMINVSNFSDFQEAIEYILEVNNDATLRLKHLTAYPFHNNKEPECINEEYIINPVLRLIHSDAKPSPRKYRKRQLREHTFSSSAHQSLISLRCRIEGAMWRLGWKL